MTALDDVKEQIGIAFFNGANDLQMDMMAIQRFPFAVQRFLLRRRLDSAKKATIYRWFDGQYSLGQVAWLSIRYPGFGRLYRRQKRRR